MASLRSLQLLWHTARYLRPAQVASRLRLRARAAVRRIAPAAAHRRYVRAAERASLTPPARLWGRPDPSALTSLADPGAWTRAVDSAADARRRRFTFLNESADLGRPLDWHPSRSQLWRYQLHYFGVFPAWMAVSPADWPEARGLMEEWIAACPVEAVPDAWHPFVVSERVANWMLTIELGAPSMADVPAKVWASLAAQTVFVARNLETDVGGNHYLKNLKALAIASAVFGGAGAARLRARYPGAFARELARQLLADGAHYERTPMYHALVLVDAIDVAWALLRGGGAIPPLLAESIDRMRAYLPTVTHPDGEIALFNDSVFGEAPRPLELERAASAVLGAPPEAPMSVTHALLACGAGEVASQPRARAGAAPGDDGGIVRVTVQRERGVLLVDVGRACPDDLPAHAHADFFSFEISLDGRRVAVDSGVGEYQTGSWREYYRSTRAHNTVAVDGLDQIECWGSFRVARRANILRRQTIAGPLVTGVLAWHDGYRRLPQPILAGRAIVAIDDRAWLVLDRLEGEGTHGWESFLHLHPDVSATLDGASGAALQSGNLRVAVAWFGLASARLARAEEAPRQGWYAPEFGRHLPSTTLVLRGGGMGPARFGYVIAPEASRVAVSDHEGALSVRIDDAVYIVRESPGGLDVQRAPRP